MANQFAESLTAIPLKLTSKTRPRTRNRFWILLVLSLTWTFVTVSLKTAGNVDISWFLVLLPAFVIMVAALVVVFSVIRCIWASAQMQDDGAEYDSGIFSR